MASFELHELIIEQLRFEKSRRMCLAKLSHFVKEFWSEIVANELIWNWHMDVLCDEIQQADERVFKRQPRESDLIFNIPPGTSKTKILSVMSTAWEFARMPEIKVFVGSFSDSAVTGIADEVRLIMRSEKYQTYFPNTVVRGDRDSLHNFKTTANGEFFAFTVGGTITSKHADILKVDDPLNPKQAASVAQLKTANDFFDKTLPTRKVDKAVTPTYLIMQRLAVNDPTGHLLEKKGERIKHICLPGTASKHVKPVEYLEMYEDGLLDKIRLGPEVLKDLKTDLGSSGYAGQIEQTPVPDGGTIWQKWFIEVPDENFPSPSAAVEMQNDWDLAYTKEEVNSASAFFKTGFIGNKLFIFDFNWRWLEFPELIKWMKETDDPHYIEAKATGKSARQALRKQGIAAIEVNVSSDKIARAKDATPTAEAGLIYVKKSMTDRLYNDSKQGILFFPNGVHNDLADALSQMIVRRTNKGRVVVANQVGQRPGPESDGDNLLDSL